MELSIFLAKVWGIYIVIVCIALLIRRKWFESIIRELDNPMGILLSGVLALGIGVPQVVAHNIWIADWRVIITILGWATIAKGAFLLFYPQMSPRIAKAIAKSGFYQLLLVFYILAGLYLIFVGFGY